MSVTCRQDSPGLLYEKHLIRLCPKRSILGPKTNHNKWFGWTRHKWQYYYSNMLALVSGVTCRQDRPGLLYEKHLIISYPKRHIFRVKNKSQQVVWLDPDRSGDVITVIYWHWEKRLVTQSNSTGCSVRENSVLTKAAQCVGWTWNLWHAWELCIRA